MYDGAYPPGVTGKMIDALEVQECCGTCRLYDGDYCTARWNNADRDYLIPARDERKPTDYCEDYEQEG